MRAVALSSGLLAVLLALPAGAAEDPLAALALRVRAGDAAGALAALSALPEALSGEPDAGYLRARLLMDRGEHAAALAALPRAGKLPARVEDDVALRRAQLLVELGRCAEAQALARSLADRGLAPGVSLPLIARCATLAGDANAAVAALTGALQHVKAPAARAALQLRLAQALLAAGATTRERAVETFARVRLEHPDRPEAALALEGLAALGEPVELDGAQRVALAERWLELRQPARALEVVDAGTLPPRGPQRAAWLHLRGMALYSQRTRYAEAAPALARAARERGAMEAFDSFHAARAWARANRDQRAVRELRQFVKNYPKSRFVPQAGYTSAWLELRHGMAGGARNMQRFIDSKLAAVAPELARTGLFQLAMSDFARGRFTRALAQFERYAGTGQDAMIRGRGLYWAGRAAQGAGKRARATQLFIEAREVEPLHWYALLSAARLSELGRTPSLPFPAATGTAAGPGADGSPALQPAALSPSLPPAAAFYARLGLMEDARAALAAEQELVRSRAPAGREGEALARAHAMFDDHASAHRLVVRQHAALLAAAPTAATRWAWEAAYARPHDEAAQQHAREQGLDPALVHAVMRKESAFDPNVVSYADAIGLMQLLPDTAAKVAGGLGLPYERELLFEPGYNLRLGSRLLGQLAARFEGQLPLAIAAYNAGAHRVEPWLSKETRKGGVVDLDIFVERIPIDQTRNYVRRVITNWARYRYLATGEEPWSELRPALSALASSSRRRR